jgi:hypothetical protein
MKPHRFSSVMVGIMILTTQLYGKDVIVSFRVVVPGTLAPLSTGVCPEILSALYQNIMSVITDGSRALAFQDHIIDRYMLPALFREYAMLRSDPAKWKTRLLMIPLKTLQHGLRSYPLASNDSSTAQEIPYLASLPSRRREQWEQMSAIFSDLAAIVRRYLADSSLVNDGTRRVSSVSDSHLIT